MHEASGLGIGVMSLAVGRVGNYIQGRWKDALSGRSYASVNPADRDDEIGLFPRSDAQDVQDAVDAARAALPGWARTPPAQRGACLARLALLIEQRKTSLSHAITREMGKPLGEAETEVGSAIDYALFMSGEGRRMVSEVLPSEQPEKLYMTLRHPLGVVGVITPWNLPLAIPISKICTALVAGCTVVFKPAEQTPSIASEVMQLLVDAEVPDGVVNLVNGFGDEVGAALVRHPAVKGISFTGSLEVGRWINQECGALMKRCALELGSKNAVIVMPDADLEAAAAAAVRGAFATSGQRCTASSRIIVHERVHEHFSDLFLDRVAKLEVGNGMNPSVDVGPIVSAAQKDRVLSYIGAAREDGAELVIGGKEITTAPLDRGNFIQPTVFDRVQPEMPLAREEVFGPVTAILRTRSLEHALSIANGVDYGLVCSIYTNDLTAGFRAINRLEFGMVNVNCPTTGAETHVPFGGMKSTGNGFREGSAKALDAFTEWKTVAIALPHRAPRATGFDELLYAGSDAGEDGSRA